MRRSPPSDLSLALLAAAAVFVVYVRTLLPDLGGYEDTPKFQYLGAVLGTAHRPGYPLYVLLSHLFSYLPVGNIAYRADLLSAVAGAAAVAHVFLLARAIGCRRAAAWLGAVGLGLGSAFWNYAVIAEVYTLAALLLVAVLYWMVRWGQSGRPAHLYAASACFALGLGNHLSIGMTGPAIGLFLLAAPVRRTLTLRRVVLAALIVASGCLQYLYVLVRTVQGAPWVEASAGTVPELLDLLKADSYREFVLPMTWQNLATVYVPKLAEFARLEYGLAGLALVGIGIVWSFRLGWRPATLLALSALGVLGLVLHLFGDMRGFLVPVWAVVAVFLATGGDAIQQAASRLPGRAWASLAALGLVVAPAWPLTANFAANDWSHRTADARFLRAVVDHLPARSAIVREDYVLDAMLNYLEAIERHPNWAGVVRPEVDAVLPVVERGVPVFTFDRAYGMLAAQGFNFDAVRVRSQPLADVVRALPRGSVVAIAAGDTGLPVELAGALGLPPAVSAAPRRYLALVATIGSAPTVVQDGEEASARLEPSPGTPRLRHPVEARASGEGVLAILGDQILEAAADGLVVLIVDARTGSVDSHALRPPELRVPRTASMSLYRLTGRRPGLDAGGGMWTDATAVAGGGLMNLTVNNFAAFDATVTVYASATVPLSPGIDGRFLYGPGPDVEVRLFDREVETDRVDLGRALAADGLPAERLGGARHVARIHHTVNDQGDTSSWGLALGAAADRVWVRGVTDLPNVRRVTVSPSLVRRYLDDEVLSLVNASGSYDWMFGWGWHRAEREATGEIRRMAEPEARILLPIAGGSAIDVTLSLRGPASDADPAPWAGLSMNGLDLGRCALTPAWNRCTWHAPAHAVVDGTNDLVVRSSSAGAAVAVRQIMLRRR